MSRSKFLFVILASLLLAGCGRGDKAGRPLSIDLRPKASPVLLYTYGKTSVRLDTIDGRYKGRYDRDTLDFFVLMDSTGLLEAVLIPDTTKLTYRRGDIRGARYADEVMEWQRLIDETTDSITPDLSDFLIHMEGRRLCPFYAADALRRFPDDRSAIPMRILRSAQYSQADLFTALGLPTESGYYGFPDTFGSEQRETEDFIKPDRYMAVLALTEADMDSKQLHAFYHIADSIGVKSLLLMTAMDDKASFLPEADRTTRFVGDSIGEASEIVTKLGATALPAYFVVDTLRRIIDRPESLDDLTDYILSHDHKVEKKKKRR
jgi:hypothetical protein